MELYLFYPLAFFSVIAAFSVIFNKGPVNSAVSLIAMMLGLAGIFVTLHAHLLATLQVLVYAGAIMVLFMFVIMLLNLRGETGEGKVRQRNTMLSVLTGLLLLGVLHKINDINSLTQFESPKIIAADFGTTAAVGTHLFTDFLLPFEIASVLLLVAMIGAVVLAKTDID